MGTAFDIIMLATACILGCAAEKGDFVGCYYLTLEENIVNTHTGHSVDVCISACEQIYYKYALLSNGSSCYCSNSPGSLMSASDMCNKPCPRNSTQICGGDKTASVYDTNFNVPGPPTIYDVLNVTETACKIRWNKPDAFTSISGYTLKAEVSHTYAEKKPLPVSIHVSNISADTWIYNLHPGTEYIITLAAESDAGPGINVTLHCETVIGTPDPGPPEVIIIGRHGETMVIHVPEAKNYNGPVSHYQVVVALEMYQQGFIAEYLKPYQEAMKDGLSYYIAAELDPDEIVNDFVVGDKRTFNGMYYNAPLPIINDIEISVGIVSEKHGMIKKRYAGSSLNRTILNISERDDVSGVVVGLGVAIAVGVVLLLIGIGFIIVLRKKFEMLRLYHSSQSMPLSPSEPCVEIENSGFLPEVEENIDHYGNLKRKLWNIPRSVLETDIACVVGVGSYGRFTRGSVQQHGALTPGLIQIIADRELQRDNKRLMLQELDMLIKSNEHENVISLIGICETNTTLFVVLEDCWNTLKDTLISLRTSDLQNNKFTTLTEQQAFDYAKNICRGMEYLSLKKIVHKRLCCRNVFLNTNGIPKIAGFGLSHVNPLDKTPDYTRWTAQEMFKQSRFSTKSDVWSFACLLWELITLGGTPYPSISSSEVGARVLRGLRLSQLRYINEQFYQLCLQCWQIDLDERPTFSDILKELDSLCINAGVLDFTHYNGFEYEPYLQNLEFIS